MGRWKVERHARLAVLYERFYLNVVDPGFLNPVSHLSGNGSPLANPEK